MPDSALAIVCVYNEADILVHTVSHLVSEGCRVHLIDNWSTDGSYEMTANWCGSTITRERWPANGPLPVCHWVGLLDRTAEIAAASDAPWCIKHDADEIRRTPWPGVTLAEGFRRVAAEGYNCVDHQCYQFPPVDNSYQGNPERYFTRYTTDLLDCRVPRQDAWANTGTKVDLSLSAGHRVQFPGRLIYPVKWTIKHYPIRSQHHGERRIFQERLPRQRPEERAIGWFVQYDDIKPGHNFLWNPAVLKEWGNPESGTPQDKVTEWCRM
jgi:hypothetical protein